MGFYLIPITTESPTLMRHAAKPVARSCIQIGYASIGG